MQNKNIFYIIFGNILWSLIPVIVVGLFNEISIITIIFLRFFVSGIILMIIAVLIAYINNKYSSNQPLRIKDLFKFTYSKNEGFFKLRYLYYFAIMGFFGIILQLIFFFLALKISSVSLTMIGFQIAIIFVAIYEHGAQSEKLDKFKGLYIIILVFSIGIIILVKSQESARFSLLGFFYIFLFTLCLTFFQITIDKDSYSKDEIKLINKNELYKVPRLLIKISFTFIMGIILMIPFIFIIYLIPVQTDLSTEIGQFYSDFSNIFQILLRWEILFLIFGSTIFPYLLIFIAYAKWSPYNLTYRQWNCILTIIEPIGGIFFGVLFGVDSFPIEFLVIVLFLLIITILLRYIHESTNKVNAYLLLSKKKGTLKGLSLKILKFSGVFSIQSLIGTHDILVYIRTNSFREFRYLVDEKIRKLKEIKNIKILFINEIIKITS